MWSLKNHKTEAADFPLVCISGASSDVGAYAELLENLQPDLGIAIVIVNQLSPVSDLLLERLPQFTRMKVAPVTDGSAVLPNHVFIGGRDRDIHVRNGVFHLEVSTPSCWPDVATIFLRSLTKHWHGRLIAVIYSSYAGDGAPALKGLKEAGGRVIAQESKAMNPPDMALSADANCHVDSIVPIAGIAAEIERVVLSATAECPEPADGLLARLRGPFASRFPG